MVNQNNDSTKFQRNVGKVVIYLKTFEYELIKESAGYEVSRRKEYLLTIDCKTFFNGTVSFACNKSVYGLPETQNLDKMTFTTRQQRTTEVFCIKIMGMANF